MPALTFVLCLCRRVLFAILHSVLSGYIFIDLCLCFYDSIKRFSLWGTLSRHEYRYFGFLLGFLSSEEVLGEIFDYGQYIIYPEMLCRTERYTDTILALTAYIHGHSEQMPLPPNIACGTLLSITLVSIENSPVYIPSYILYEDTYCTRAFHTHTRWLFSQDPLHTESIEIHVSKWILGHLSHVHSCTFPRVKLTFFYILISYFWDKRYSKIDENRFLLLQYSIQILR